MPSIEARRPRWRPRHVPERDATVVRHHYDVGNCFYRLLLGETMVYSCAYWRRPPSDGFTLEQAQTAKLELICRKLGLRPGMRLLDLGCGWGSLVVHAAREHGVHAVGVTLSPEQASYARQQAAAAGVAERVEIRVQDYRAVDDGPFDAVASVGMAEHVGAARLPGYARRIVDLLRPGGRLLNHAIARRPHGPARRSSFIDRYVFPDGELVPLAAMTGVLEDAGLEVRDVEALREHYTTTLTAWYRNLADHWAEAGALVGEERARAWRLYLAGSAAAFDTDRIGVNQILAVRTPPGQHSGLPATRAWMAA